MRRRPSPSAGMRRPQILTRNSLVQRFFLVFLLAVAVPVIVIGIAVTVGYRSFSLQLATGRIDETLSRLTESIDEEIRRTTLLTATLSTDPRFSADVERFARSRTAKESYSASQLMEDRLASFFNYTNKTGVVALYLRGLPVFVYRNNFQLFDRPMQRTGWFQTVTGQPNATLILDDLDSYSLLPSRRPLLKVAVCPSPAALANGFEALVVAFRVSFLDTIADYEFAASNEELILVDPHARVILSSSSTRMGTTLEAALLKPAILRRGGITFLVSQAAIPSAGWTLVGITNYSRVARDIDVFAQIARGVLLVLIVLFSVYIEVFFRQVIRPIATVTREMGNVEKGNWEAAVPETGVNEIARLARGFNTMVTEIRRLTEEREQQERERARLELEALRLQISPHFLTNTLNSIRMMAAVSNAEPIRRMTAALMRVVSSSFRGDDRLAPLGEELDTLEQYILIMRVRFGDTFDVSTEIPTEMRGVRVLRMLLQPLVENSILHGLQGLDRRGRIVISGNEERIPDMTDVVILEVRDNGHGMSESTAAAALNGAPQRHGGMTTIGLYNVHRRVVLNHGNGFGLVVTSEPGVFTSVKLRLPRISGES